MTDDETVVSLLELEIKSETEKRDFEAVENAFLALGEFLETHPDVQVSSS